MLSHRIIGRGIILVPFVSAGLLAILLLIFVSPSNAFTFNVSQSRSTNPMNPLTWVSECIDCNKRSFELTNQSLKLDANGNPNIAYGGNHLYYAQFNGASWTYETADNSSGVGGGASLALDKNGNPHISYHDRVQHALKYAFRDNEGWHTEVVDDGPGNNGAYTSIALDQYDLPHITYNDIANNVLRYAYFDGTSWQKQNIAKGANYSSLALDSAGNPHVSYHASPTGVLSYAYYDLTAWITETIDSGVQAASFTSLVVDDNGYSHIGYFDELNGILKYASQDANGWTLQELSTGMDSGSFLSLEIAPDGSPWMSYYDATNGDLILGHLQDSLWISTTIDSIGNVGGYTSLEFDQSGKTYIAYAEVFCQRGSCEAVTLKLAQQEAADWFIQNLDYSIRAGGYSSLQIDPVGDLHAGYIALRGNISDLRYASRQNGSWLVSKLDGTGNLGINSQPSMVLDSVGNPRFSYTLSQCDAKATCTPIGLVYATLGITSLITETIDSGMGIGLLSSIVLDGQDNPHISYMDGGNLALKYASLDSLGWHTEVVTTTNLVSDTVNTHVMLDALGYAHIVYNNSGLRYAHQDQDGWHITLVDAAPDVRASSMAMDSTGAIQIAYMKNISNTLNYAYQDQGNWFTEVITGTQTDGYISLKLDANDVPYIAYHAIPGGDLVLAHRNGSGWVKETVASVGDVGKYTSLVLASDGSIFISFYDATNSDLRLAKQVPVIESFLPILHK